MKLEEFLEFVEGLKEKEKRNTLGNCLYNHFPKGIFGYNPSYILLRPWKLLEKIWQEIRFAWQRVFRGWDDRATWSIDYYIAKQIVELVRRLRQYDFAIPMRMFIDMPHDENFNVSKENEEIAHQKWLSILDEIIIGFEDFINEDRKFFDWDRTRFERAFDLFREYFQSLWW